ncbi:MAG TPA: cytochrome c [Terriglobales bacterium]|nr:cytochrome c [Terriglobales bacterium]
MHSRFAALLILLTVSLAFLASGQKKTVEKVPIRHTSPASGPEMYRAYCASCHGTAGKGDGPAASALKMAPADLTMLAKLNNGTFPRNEVYEAISGQHSIPAHGSKDMPVWGTLFRSVDPHESISMLRINNLTDYIASLQAK